jgi:hypothetical protein
MEQIFTEPEFEILLRNGKPNMASSALGLVPVDGSIWGWKRDAKVSAAGIEKVDSEG